MQRAQRGRENAALNFAIAVANRMAKPVVVAFALTAAYPGAQRRHYRFLLDGLCETKTDIEARGVSFVLRLGDPADVIASLVSEISPALVVGDENPLRVPQAWRLKVSAETTVPFVLVDADVVVPTSHFPKQEYAARTLRPKIHKLLATYLKRVPDLSANTTFAANRQPRGERVEAGPLLLQLKVGGVGEVADYAGGTSEAMLRLKRFIKMRLDLYAASRNEPTPYVTSELSAHLHFGHIGPLRIACDVADALEADQTSVSSYFEELIVRRELAVNYVARNPRYDQLAGCPSWALRTLERHRADPRPICYSAHQLEAGETHDPLWNAAQHEMVFTGRMHNYLRMYWAKKILEWSPDPETAFAVALDLNDRYEMDGRDPNGYVGIAWSIGGLHDRPWFERPIFGTVRFMSYESTRRKFDSAGYIGRVRDLVAQLK
jgi:deoxyribodipyrimidine photo-lyase